MSYHFWLEVMQTVGALATCFNTFLLLLALAIYRRNLKERMTYLELTKQYANLMRAAAQEGTEKADGIDRKIDRLREDILQGSVPMPTQKV